MAASLPPDPYKALGVARDAKLPELRAAHRKLVLQCHPDKVHDPALKAGKQKQFQSVQQAYELLSDDGRRQQYDEQVKLVELRKEMSKGNPTPRSDRFGSYDRTAEPRRSTYEETPVIAGSRIKRDASHSKTEDDNRQVRERAHRRRQYDVEMPPKESSKPQKGHKGDSSTAQTRRYDPRRKAEGILVTKGHINGFKTDAIPDTGAEFNIVAATFAKKLGLQIRDQDPSQCRLLRMANGKHIKTVGVVDATWDFASGPLQSWKITLYVLSDFVYDVVLGGGFLFATQTMSHYKERLCRIPRPLQSLSVLRVNLLGSATKYVRGYLGNQAVRALPDSGSEPSLVSYEYAKRRGWLMTMDMMDQNLLQFADGSVAKTEGSISAKWWFPGERASNLRETFHILRGCPHDVILGQDVLEESDAFLEHEDAFLEVTSDMEASGLNLVIWLPKKKKAQPAPVSEPIQRAAPFGSRSDRLHIDELQRRAVMDRKIARMKAGILKNATLADEMQTRREYDTRTGNVTTTSARIDQSEIDEEYMFNIGSYGRR